MSAIPIIRKEQRKMKEAIKRLNEFKKNNDIYVIAPTFFAELIAAYLSDKNVFVLGKGSS